MLGSRVLTKPCLALQQQAAASCFVRRAALRLARPSSLKLQSKVGNALNGRTNGSTVAVSSPADLEQLYLHMRAEHVTKHFSGSLGVDDFLSRVEIALFELGFDGDNSIGE